MNILVFALLLVINLSSCNLTEQNSQDCFEKDFKPKSKDKIASMTPHQLIDELTMIEPSAFRTYEEVANYQNSVKYSIRESGKTALPILTGLFNSAFHDQRDFPCDKARVDTIKEVAHDLDRFEFRLRGTSEGRKMINAFERAIKRAERPKFTEKDISYYRKLYLEDLKEVNTFDQSIKDTLWVRYRIEISRNELLKFTNHLIEIDPAYPSWSSTDFIKDHTRINEAGNPMQVYVLKKPERFYEAYLEFKKTDD